MRKSREVLDYRWQEMSVIASDTYEDELELDAIPADAELPAAEMPAGKASSQKAAVSRRGV